MLYKHAIVTLSLAVLIFLSLKVCKSLGKTQPISQTQTQAQNSKLPKSQVKTTTGSEANSKSSLTSYFRHEPYGPKTYAFGFEVNDNKTGNIQFRDERRYLNGSIEGSYGYVRPDGRVTVTHFIADAQLGYTSQTRTFEENESESDVNSNADNWRSNFWPTRKPNIIMERPNNSDMMQKNVTYDEIAHLNLTMVQPDDNVTNALKAQHGLDVNHIDLEKDLLNPVLSNIINGNLPLQTSAASNMTEQKLGFGTFNNIIPSAFPIVPFELPQKTSEKEEKESINHVENVSNTTTTPRPLIGTPKPLTNAGEDVFMKQKNWITKIVNDSRQDFLKNLPNL